MQITRSFSSPSTLGVASGVNNKPNTPIKNLARSAEPVDQLEHEHSLKKQDTPSVVIDEQAMALYEESQASISTQGQSKNETLFSANQDQPSAKNETAVASYQAIGNLAQRESVQQLFGIDILV